MKKIISIILGIMLMLSMSVTSFAANINDVITPNPETIVFEIACTKAVPAKDANGEDLDDMIYTFTTKVSNKTKSNINISDYPVALIFINDKTYETIDAVNFNLENKWINANYQKEWADLNDSNDPMAPSDFSTNVVRMNYDETTTVDIKVMIASKSADDKTAKITTVTDLTKTDVYPVVITLDVTPKATPNTPTTETTTETTTKAPETSTDASTDAPTQAPTKAPEITNPVEDTEDDYVAPVDPEIPDTGAVAPVGAIGTLIGSAVAAVVAKKRKKIDD